MNKSRRRCGFLLVLWFFFTANLSQKVELFPQDSKVQKAKKVEVQFHQLDSLFVLPEIHLLPETAQPYTVAGAK